MSRMTRGINSYYPDIVTIDELDSSEREEEKVYRDERCQGRMQANGLIRFKEVSIPHKLLQLLLQARRSQELSFELRGEWNGSVHATQAHDRGIEMFEASL